MVRDLHAIAQTQRLFVLQNGKPVRITNPLEWIEWMQTQPRAAEKTLLPNGRELYTSFMGYCGEQHESSPFTFATALKPEPQMPEFAVMLEWFYTWKDAEAGHKRYVEQFSKLQKPAKQKSDLGFTPLVRLPEKTVYREDEMRRLLTTEQFNEYCSWSESKQLHMAHLLTNRYDFENAKSLAAIYPDDARKKN